MAPCSGNVITPRMIRRGQVQIGDKIEFEDMRVSAFDTSEEAIPEAVSAAAESPDPGRAAAGETAAPVSEAVPVSAADTLQTLPKQPEDAVPAAAAPPTQSSAESNHGVWLRPQAENTAGGSASPYIDPNAAFQANTASIPLIYQNMTDYVNSLENTGQQTPSFGVPSNPLVPPEYEQTIDYDSIQYMNGFLRTQIGRYMRVEQLVGSDTLQDRYGFLVGVGNNYLLMQDISNGNISIVDLYSVKFVYMYFGEPVFPNIPFGPSGR